jgi:aspartate-semialdehyde dehydrogenase
VKPLAVAIVGATGLVGEALLRVLAERRFPVGELRLFAGERSAGRRLRFGRNEVPVHPLPSRQNPSGGGLAAIDVAFFAANAQISQAFAPGLARSGTLVVDKSPAFRMEPDVPLVVPEVNVTAIAGRRLVANPNCSTIPLAVALGPVHRAFGLRWLNVSTYQSVSGAGKDALEEYQRQTRGDDRPPTVLPRRIAGNVLPENGSVDDSGYGEEERKIAQELRKILADPDIAVSATSVRVPVAVCHAQAVAFEPREQASLQDIARLLRSAPGVKFLEGSQYATPLEVAGTDDVVVGRLRADTAHPGAYLAWIVSDNLRKGAATNAVQIAEAACVTAAGAAV